jgi:lipopolysaccharide transport system permease protein
VTDTPTAVPTVVIEPPSKWAALRLKELWGHRELFWMFAWRDLTVRYKQTELGIAWAILQPVLTVVVFSLVFGRLAGLGADTGGIPYPVFSFAALLPWTYFASTVTRASNVLVDNTALVTKVYFPRLLLPLSASASGVVDLGIAFLVLIGMMLFYGLVPTWGILLIPLFVVLGAAAAIGVGLWLAALNVEYRDVRFLTPFLVQIWMYLTPVVYPINRVPARFQALYAVNPMVGVVEGFRWALFGQTQFPATALIVAVAVTVPMVVSGLFFFRRMERVFADVV